MQNPLLEQTGLPSFSKIKPEHVMPAVDHTLEENRRGINALLAAHDTYTWDNLIHPLEEMGERLDRVWSPVSHLNAVVNSEALREVYNACLPKLSDYATELGQNTALFEAYEQIAKGPEYSRLDTAQKKVIDNALRDFRLSGITLEPEAKTRYRTVMQRLSALSSQFSDNLLDATNAWKRQVNDPAQLAGLPESAIALAKQTAEREGMEGWCVTLEFPSYLAVMTYADHRPLRKEMYTAYVTRASDQGPHAGKWDNTEVMEEILSLRYEMAQLLGFAHYAEYSLATKMADSVDQVMSFLNELAEHALSPARRELDEVRAFAETEDNLSDLQAWDIPYYSEKLRQEKYSISQEELKPYFSVDNALSGMFAVVKRLYGLDIIKGE
ncbi:MAG: M3 family metallopeptidase, partial [Nitrospiria bacterium]